MFEIQNDLDQIFKSLKPQQGMVEITGNIPQDLVYLKYLTECDDNEITPDHQILGYDLAVKENLYLTTHFRLLSEQVWMIGRTGQGDEWFIDRKTLQILFYDHDLGEYKSKFDFKNMQIDFTQFLQFCMLMKDFEQRLELYTFIESSPEFIQFKQRIHSIHPDLVENYPFNFL